MHLVNGALEYHDRGRFGPDSDPIEGLDRRPWWLHDYCLVRELRSDLRTCTVLARRKGTHDRVIVRFLFASEFSDPSAIRRMQGNIAVLQLLDDPRFARVIGCRVSHHGVAVISELLTGRSLAGILNSAGRLPVEAAVWVAAQTLFGIGAAQQVGACPGHIEPRHVVISPGGWVKIRECAFDDEPDAARLLEDRTHVRAVISMLFACLTGHVSPANSALGGDKWREIPGDMDEQPERSLSEWCMGLTGAQSSVQALDAGVSLDGWAAEVLGAGWEEKARMQLTRLVAPCQQELPRKGVSASRHAKRLGYARYRSVGVLAACVVVLAAGAAEWFEGQHRSLPPHPKGVGAASTPATEVTRAPSPGLPAEKPEAPPGTPSPSVAAVDLPVQNSAPGSITDSKRRKESARPGASPTTAKSPSPSADAPAADALESLRITDLNVEDDGVATAKVAIVATSIRPFTVTVTWHTPTDDASFDSPGPQQAAYVISLSGRLTYDFELQHQFPDGACRIGVKVLNQPELDLPSGYRSATGC